MSTYKLNIRYKIPGYKITQPRTKANNDNTNDDNKSEIKLIKDYRNTSMQASSISNNDIYTSDFKERLELLEKRIANIETYLSSVPQE